jgi:hypothetical protein
MTPQERLVSWRDAIAGELDEATKVVPPLEEIHVTAATAAQEVLDDYGAVQRLIGPVISQPETPLKLRCDAHLVEVERAKSKCAQALADLQAARSNVTSLQRALAQVDLIVTTAEEAEAEAEAKAEAAA